MEHDVKKISPLSPHDNIVEADCGRDKSLTHRAIMFSALAEGQSTIKNPLLGADCVSTMDCFKALGVSFQVRDNEIIVNSPSWQGFKSPATPLDCGNSGTTARLISGLLAGIPGLTCTLVGDKSLSQRPMMRVVAPLRNMGADITGEDGGNKLPLKIKGKKLRGTSIQIDKATAQVKSAVILAGLYCDGQTKVTLPKGSRDHTENILRMLGIPCKSEFDSKNELVSLTGPSTIKPSNYNIPVDPSSAAFFCVYGLLRPSGRTRILNVLANPTRTGFLQALKLMSQKITEKKPSSEQSFVETVVDIEVEGSFPLSGLTIMKDQVPTLVDEIPILAVAAAFAKSPSVFMGLAELRVKESDRLTKTHELLTLAGCSCEIRGDDLHIEGGLSKVKAFTFDSEGDHRLAMAGAILAKFANEPSKILEGSCVNVSFPNFYQELEKFEA